MIIGFGRLGPSDNWPGDLVVTVRVAQPAPEPVRGADLRMEITLTAAEAAHGCHKAVTLDRSLSGGRGSETVYVPAGARDGQTLRYCGLGAPGAHGGGPGDLVVTVRVVGFAKQPTTQPGQQKASCPSRHAANPDDGQLKAFVAKVAGRVGQRGFWVHELGCYQVHSTRGSYLAGRWHNHFLILRDDDATVADFDAFARACASWVRGNKEYNNNMTAYPVLLQSHARHDVVDYAKQSPPGFLTGPAACLTLPTVVNLSTGEVMFMDKNPFLGGLMWKGVKKAAVEALG